MLANIKEVICVHNSVVTTSGMTQPLLSVTLPKIFCWKDLYISNDTKDKDGKVVNGTVNNLKVQYVLRCMHIVYIMITIG